MQTLLRSIPWLRELDVIAQQRCPARDVAHDYLHARRVAVTCARLAHSLPASPEIAVAAALAHELFGYAKNDPRRALSGIACVPEARRALQDSGCPEALVEPICTCIADHPYSLGKVPESLEAKILQDADRIDAIGAIGIARCFSTGQALGCPLYALDDPLCEARAPDDSRYTLDHFFRKLLGLCETLHTQQARELANERSAYMRSFLSQFSRELA